MLRPRRNIAKRTKPRLSDVFFDREKKIVTLKESSIRMELKISDVRNFYRGHKALMNMGAGLALLVAILSVQRFVTHAETIALHPENCLGGWRDPQHAEGKPDLEFGASPDEFTNENSSVLSGQQSQVFCSGFTGKIPEGTEPKRVVLRLSLAFRSELAPVAATTSVEVTSESLASSTQEALNATSTETVYEITLPEATSTDPSAPASTALPQTTAPSEGEPVEPAPAAEALPAEPVEAPAPQASEPAVSGEDAVSTPEPAPSAAPAAEDPAPAPAESASILDIFKPKAAYAQGIDDVAAMTSSTPASTTEPLASNATGTPPVEIASTTGDGEPAGEPRKEDVLEVLYSFDGENWKTLGKISKANFYNAEFEVPLDEIEAWEDLSALQISIQSLPAVDTYHVYLDGMVLETEYAEALSDEADGQVEYGVTFKLKPIRKSNWYSIYFENEEDLSCLTDGRAIAAGNYDLLNVCGFGRPGTYRILETSGYIEQARENVRNSPLFLKERSVLFAPKDAEQAAPER